MNKKAFEAGYKSGTGQERKINDVPPNVPMPGEIRINVPTEAVNTLKGFVSKAQASVEPYLEIANRHPWVTDALTDSWLQAVKEARATGLPVSDIFVANLPTNLSRAAQNNVIIPDPAAYYDNTASYVGQHGAQDIQKQSKYTTQQQIQNRVNTVKALDTVAKLIDNPDTYVLGFLRANNVQLNPDDESKLSSSLKNQQKLLKESVITPLLRTGTQVMRFSAVGGIGASHLGQTLLTRAGSFLSNIPGGAAVAAKAGAVAPLAGLAGYFIGTEAINAATGYKKNWNDYKVMQGVMSELAESGELENMHPYIRSAVSGLATARVLNSPVQSIVSLPGSIMRGDRANPVNTVAGGIMDMGEAAYINSGQADPQIPLNQRQELQRTWDKYVTNRFISKDPASASMPPTKPTPPTLNPDKTEDVLYADSTWNQNRVGTNNRVSAGMGLAAQPTKSQYDTAYNTLVNSGFEPADLEQGRRERNERLQQLNRPKTLPRRRTLTGR